MEACVVEFINEQEVTNSEGIIPFGTGTIGAAHLENPTGSMISSLSNCSRSASTLSLSANGTVLALIKNG